MLDAVTDRIADGSLEPIAVDNASSRVEQRLREALMAGSFQPGQRLTIGELADQLGTSATPVREAVLRLAAVRGLELRRGHSLCVPRLGRERFLELRDIRLLMEGYAAERAAASIDAAAIARLKECFDQYRRQQAKAAVAATLHYNQRFRFQLYEAARMPALQGMIEDLWLQVGPLFNLLYPRLPTDPQYETHFEEMLAGLRVRNGAKVRRAVEAAIHAGTKRLLATWGEPASRAPEPVEPVRGRASANGRARAARPSRG